MNKSEATFAPIPIPTMSSKRMWAVAAVGTYWRPVLLVFLPFSAGYFLSYFFRTINAVLASALTKELGLSASDLGLMTGVYFLTFAIVQLPLGILLDRFGPRRVQCVFLLLTAIGAALFAATDRFRNTDRGTRADRSGRGRGANCWSQSHRSVLSAREGATSQRLFYYVGHPRGRGRNVAGRMVADFCRLAEPARLGCCDNCSCCDPNIRGRPGSDAVGVG